MAVSVGLWGLLGAGCAPSGYLARKIVEAPNRVPAFVRPEGRVTLRWPDGVIERFPTGTNEVGHPPASLRWVRVEPAAFGMETETVPRQVGRHAGADIRFRFRLPAVGLPPGQPARGTVFVLHGYGMDLETMFPWAVYLAEAGWRSVLVDLRGHGGSGGARIGFGTLETNDLRELRLRLGGAGGWPGPTFVLGHSLGAAIALRWAAADPGLAGAVALAPFAEFPAAAERLRREYASWLPSGWVRRAVDRVPGLLGVTPAGLNPLDALAAAGGMVRGFVVTASDDVVAPPRDGARLRWELGPGSAWIQVDGVTHETCPTPSISTGNPSERGWHGRGAEADARLSAGMVPRAVDKVLRGTAMWGRRLPSRRLRLSIRLPRSPRDPAVAGPNRLCQSPWDGSRISPFLSSFCSFGEITAEQYGFRSRFRL